MALFRAIESTFPANRRLFDDPFAVQFLRPRLALLARLCRFPGAAHLVSRYIDSRWAGARSSAVARTRLIDDMIAEALARGLEQLVILGAGFDARPYRLRGLSDLAIFEVDHPDTLARRQAAIRRASFAGPSSVRSVAIDFKSADLETVMESAGYSRDASTFFLWEGVTNYLTEDAVDATLRWCARAAPGSQVLFTYIHRAVLEDPSAFAGTDTLMQTLNNAGEQWTFGLQPAELADFVRGCGLELEQDIGSSEYRGRYLPRVSRLMRGYEFYRIAVARVA
jgi:methyltransferase (TIGR00027 family)